MGKKLKEANLRDQILYNNASVTYKVYLHKGLDEVVFNSFTILSWRIFVPNEMNHSADSLLQKR